MVLGKRFQLVLPRRLGQPLSQVDELVCQANCYIHGGPGYGGDYCNYCPWPPAGGSSVPVGESSVPTYPTSGGGISPSGSSSGLTPGGGYIPPGGFYGSTPTGSFGIPQGGGATVSPSTTQSTQSPSTVSSGQLQAMASQVDGLINQIPQDDPNYAAFKKRLQECMRIGSQQCLSTLYNDVQAYVDGLGISDKEDNTLIVLAALAAVAGGIWYASS